MPSLKHPRGTKASFLALASGNNLIPNQLYFLTDVDQIAMAKTTSTYIAYAKEDVLKKINTSEVLSSPSAGNISIGADKTAGFGLPLFINETGWSSELQPASFKNDHRFIKANPGANNFSSFGFLGWIATGTLTLRIPIVTTIATRAQRVGIISAGAAGSIAEYRQPGSGNLYTIGTGTPGIGGFLYSTRVVLPSGGFSGARMLIGMAAPAAGTNVEPSTLVNTVGFAQLSTTDNMQIVYGGSAAQTPIDLGSGFPTTSASSILYEMSLYSPSNSNNTAYYQITNLNSGAIASGTLTGTAGVALPDPTTVLTPKYFKTNNATAVAVAIDICQLDLLKEN